jgi:threonine/homoserine/homoserine lactone efflux protein
MSVALFGGILTGLIIALSTGPVFFTLLHTAIHKGFSKSIYFILGISFTDISIILICWFGLNQIGVEYDQTWLSIVAGIVLLLFGVSFIIKRSKPVIDENEVIKRAKLNNWGLFFKAILIDGINPIVWVFWAAISEYIISIFYT